MAKRAASRGRSKYNAKRTKVDGITFASKREAKRYGELKLLEKAGRIRNLGIQPKFPISVSREGLRMAGPGRVRVCDYVADFSYDAVEINEGGFSVRWRPVVEDVKGFKTPVYRLKKKMVEAQYGITITEV